MNPLTYSFPHFRWYWNSFLGFEDILYIYNILFHSLKKTTLTHMILLEILVPHRHDSQEMTCVWSQVPEHWQWLFVMGLFMYTSKLCSDAKIGQKSLLYCRVFLFQYLQMPCLQRLTSQTNDLVDDSKFSLRNCSLVNDMALNII